MGGKTNKQTPSHKTARKKIDKESIRPLPHTSANSLGWESCPPTIRAASVSMSSPLTSQYVQDALYATPRDTTTKLSPVPIQTRSECRAEPSSLELSHSDSTNSESTSVPSLTNDFSISLIRPTFSKRFVTGNHGPNTPSHVNDLEHPGRSNTRRSPPAPLQLLCSNYDLWGYNNAAENESCQEDDRCFSPPTPELSDPASLERLAHIDESSELSSPMLSDIWGSSIDALNSDEGVTDTEMSVDAQSDIVNIPGVAHIAALVRTQSSSNSHCDEAEDGENPILADDAISHGNDIVFPRVIAQYETPAKMPPPPTQHTETMECDWFSSWNLEPNSNVFPRDVNHTGKAVQHMSLNITHGNDNPTQSFDPESSAMVLSETATGATSKDVPSTNDEFLSPIVTDTGAENIFKTMLPKSTNLKRLRDQKSFTRLKKLRTAFSPSMAKIIYDPETGSPLNLGESTPPSPAGVRSWKKFYAAISPKNTAHSPDMPEATFENAAAASTTPAGPPAAHLSSSQDSRDISAHSSFPSTRRDSIEATKSTPLTTPDESEDQPQSRLSRFVVDTLARMPTLNFRPASA